jgi:hypothetical protein
MSGRHTGVYLAQELEALLKSFGIEKKVRPYLSCFTKRLILLQDSIHYLRQCNEQ